MRELNTKCDTAQQYIDSQKSGYNSQKQSSAHSMKVVGQLKTELMNTTKDFKGILEVRSAKIKDQQKRKVELTGSGSLAMSMTPMKQKQKDDKSNPPKNMFNSNVPSPYNSSNELSFSGMKAPASASTALTVDGSPNPGVSSNYQQQLLVAPPATQQYYEAREQAVTEVERTIAELGTLFKRLAGMIAEQQELVERVDEDVESAVANADRAHTVLLKMYDSASSNRAMYTKLSAILAIFILIFVLFLM